MTKAIEVGSFQGMKSLNKSAILNIIRLHGPISRAEIAKLTQLTAPTVTNLVTELMESRLVVESYLGESTGGRKPILLRINASAYYIVGVYAGTQKVRAITAHLDGQIVHQAEFKYPSPLSKEQFLDTVGEAIQRVIEKTDQRPEAFLGIGVGAHGLVNPQTGRILFAPNLNLRNIDLKDYLAARFDLPIIVENDVRALTLGESWFGQGQGIANFICLYVGTGVGAGIFLDYQLYRGATYTAGEIGHTTIDIHGPKCSCGNYGCLESLAGGLALARRAREAILLGKKSILEEWVNGKVENIHGELIYEAAKLGDAVAIEALAETGRYLGIGIANLINTYNPSRIILSGGISRAGQFILTPLREVVSQRALSTSAQESSIVFSDLGGDAIPIGAFTLLLDKLFNLGGFED